jgi:excisionase family DNA binding protein
MNTEILNSTAAAGLLDSRAAGGAETTPTELAQPQKRRAAKAAQVEQTAPLLITGAARCMSVRACAKYLAVAKAKVLAWIRSGKLAATDVSNSPARPQFRISPEAVKEFMASRAAAPQRASRRKREKRPPGWIDRY